jgi:hypothetical protein
MRIAVLFSLVAFTLSCQGPAGERAATGEAAGSAVTSGEFETYYADIESSNVEWVGARQSDDENTHRFTGNLTMRGVTRSVTFNAAIDIDNSRIDARSEQFLIDRTEWGVNFQSKSVFADLVDRFILDDIALVINLTATK